MFSIKVPHNGVFRKSPGRIYDGGNITIVDLIDLDEVSGEEMDSLMVQFGYDHEATNWCYYLKHGSNLNDGLYNLKLSVNL